MNYNVDVLIIGAGAAGLMCAIESGKRGKSVIVVDHSNKIGEKNPYIWRR
jgi:predicted flavoprotein YhiN